MNAQESQDNLVLREILRSPNSLHTGFRHSQEIIFLIPEFTVQVVFRQPRRVIANGALHLPLMSDFNECTRVPGRQGVAIIAFKQTRAAPVCSGPVETKDLVDFTQPQKWSLDCAFFGPFLKLA